MRIVLRREQLGFAPEAAVLLAFSRLGLQHLEREALARVLVLDLEDPGKAALADQADDAPTADPAAAQELLGVHGAGSPTHGRRGDLGGRVFRRGSEVRLKRCAAQPHDRSDQQEGDQDGGRSREAQRTIAARNRHRVSTLPDLVDAEAYWPQPRRSPVIAPTWRSSRSRSRAVSSRSTRRRRASRAARRRRSGP